MDMLLTLGPLLLVPALWWLLLVTLVICLMCVLPTFMCVSVVARPAAWLVC